MIQTILHIARLQWYFFGGSIEQIANELYSFIPYQFDMPLESWAIAVKESVSDITPLPPLDLSSDSLYEDTQTRLDGFNIAKNLVLAKASSMIEVALMMKYFDHITEIDSLHAVAKTANSFKSFAADYKQVSANKLVDSLPMLIVKDMTGDEPKPPKQASPVLLEN